MASGPVSGAMEIRARRASGDRRIRGHADRHRAAHASQNPARQAHRRVSPLAATPTTTSRCDTPARRKSRAPSAAESSAPSTACRSARAPPAMIALNHPGRRAERRRAFGRVQHRQPAAGSRAYVEKRAAASSDSRWHPRRAQFLASSRRTAGRHARIFAVQRAHDFEARFAVQAARARVSSFCPGRFQVAHQTLNNYSGRQRRGAGRSAGLRRGLCRGQLSGGAA